MPYLFDMSTPLHELREGLRTLRDGCTEDMRRWHIGLLFDVLIWTPDPTEHQLGLVRQYASMAEETVIPVSKETFRNMRKALLKEGFCVAPSP